jgi:hypothetical protein
MESTEARTVEAFSLWGAAFAMTRGVRLVQVIPGVRGMAVFVLEDGDGKASQALVDWRAGNTLIDGRSLVENQRELLTGARRIVDDSRRHRQPRR